MQPTRARISDAPVLARIHVDSWRAAYGELLPASSLDRFTHQWREESFRASLAANAEETYLIHPNAKRSVCSRSALPAMLMWMPRRPSSSSHRWDIDTVEGQHIG